MADPASATWIVPCGLTGTTAKPGRTAPAGTTTADVVGGGPAPQTPIAPFAAGPSPVTLSSTDETPVAGTPARPRTGTVRIWPGVSGPVPTAAVAGSGLRLS